MKEIKVKRDCTNIKKPKILPSNKIEIFAARKLRFKAAEYQKNNTGVVIVLPEKVQARILLVVRQRIHELNTSENRL